MEAEVQIRTAALADPTLSGYLVTGGVPRWFDRRLQPGYIGKGTCVRAKRVSAVMMWTQYGLANIDRPLFQIDVLDYDATKCRTVARAIINWFETVSFLGETSPVPHHPNFLLNRRGGEEPQVEPPGPAWVESLDYRLYVLES